ncbi:MAG: hypothetical protein GWP91_22115, partial [Rhodobacterales bacterium]|nr:hypothetical protein [Rhodobacterales bacterium]
MQDAIKNGSSGGGGGSQSDGGIGSAIKGGLGTVLGGAVKKLDWVANLGLLGAEELSEFISGEEFSTQKNADGTLNEFGQQSNWDKLNDPEYGFGKLMGDVTDNKWINRTVGLVGDLAFDPITYVGGAAMKSPMVMGKLGREALVKKAATMGMSDDVVKHVGKFGHVGLDDATRKALDVKKAGVYWGVGDASIRLPGTKTIGTATEKAFSSVRRNTAGRLVGKVGKGRGDAALAPYRRAAQTGETVIHEGRRITPKLAGLTLESVEQFTGFAGKAAEPWARSAQRVFQGQDQEVSKRVTKEINNLNVGWKYGDVVDPAKLAALSPEAQRTQALMREIYESTLEATKDPVTGEYAINMGFRGPGYLPNRQTKEAWDFFGDDVSRASFNGGTLDAGQSAAKTRVFLPGKTVDIKGRPVTFGDATIDDINQKLTEALREAGITKRMEDNSVVLVERYIGEMSRIQGHHAMLMRLREVGELGNEAHYTTEMIEGMANLSKNRDVARLLKGEVKERNLQMAQMRGEAARLGQLVSKDLDEALVRLADEAATEHATLRGFVKNIKNEIQQDAGDRSKNLKNIRAGFTAERNRLETVFNEAVAAKTEIDESIAAIKQSIEEGFIKETADVRGELDKLIRKQNAIAEKMKLDSDALEGVTEMDEMYGFVMSQAGRL